MEAEFSRVTIHGTLDVTLHAARLIEHPRREKNRAKYKGGGKKKEMKAPSPFIVL